MQHTSTGGIIKLAHINYCHCTELHVYTEHYIKILTPTMIQIDSNRCSLGHSWIIISTYMLQLSDGIY
jgi:hypothetical protein